MNSGHKNYEHLTAKRSRTMSLDTDLENRNARENLKKIKKDYRKGKKSQIHPSRKINKYRGCIKRKFTRENNERNINDAVNLHVQATSSTLKEILVVSNQAAEENENETFDQRSETASSILLVEPNCANYNEAEKQRESQKDQEIQLDGCRIVNIQYLIAQLKLIGNHNEKFGCTFNNLLITREIRHGFESTLYFKCNMCNMEKSLILNEGTNKASVIGIMNIGSGYTHLAEVAATLDIPCMSKATYIKIEDEIDNAWEASALESMLEAGREEKKLAIEDGEVTSEGIPIITVVCDGSWAKRSYRTNYNSLSGCAAIVGYRTRKILFIGVKNKFCIVCKKAEHKDTTPNHHCYKNWSGSSTAMEAAIISEGFQQSVTMHGLIYKFMIADGDSSCYKKILDLNPYAQYNVNVIKIECKNHLLRNYSNKIRELLKDTDIPLVLRNKIKGQELRFRLAISKAIEYRRKELNIIHEEKVKNLKRDILNSVSHILGEHKYCSQLAYFCKNAYDDSAHTIMSDIKLTPLHEKLESLVQNLSKHTNSLIFNCNNNMVEQFNAIIAKFVGGKRINFCIKRSYQARCAAAAVAFNTNRPIYMVHKQSTKRSPGTFTKLWESRKHNQNLRKKLIKRKNLKRRLFTGTDKDYGEKCCKPDLSPGEYEISKNMYLQNYNRTQEELQGIEHQTKLQNESSIWHKERKKRITASRFYEICTKKAHTSRKKLITSIVRPKPIKSKAIEHGKVFEKTAIAALENKIGTKIAGCGMFVDCIDQYMAASPDGIVHNNTIVEIKCPFSAKGITPDEAIKQRKVTFWNRDGTINKNHKWYYQIQGQLKITKRNFCIFAVWTHLGIKYETIAYDADFYNHKMKNQLKSFFYDCLLPELVDSRLERHMEVRDPEYVLQEIKKRQSK